MVKKQPPKPDEIIKQLFERQLNDVQVAGMGVIEKFLTDDNEGARHQRFIIRISNGHTLLMTHNVDIAPRLEEILIGDKIEFYGEYFYNDQGGGIHWTHHDKNKNHIDGYLWHNGTLYQ